MNKLLYILVFVFIVLNVIPVAYSQTIYCPYVSGKQVAAGKQFGWPFAFIKSQSKTSKQCTVGDDNINGSLFSFPAAAADLVLGLLLSLGITAFVIDGGKRG